LVGDIDLQFEGVQLRILKHLPPATAEILVIRLSLFPIGKLFVGGRNFRRGTLICGSHSATAYLENGYRRQNDKPRYFAPLSD
jgi:hypothetical protein